MTTPKFTRRQVVAVTGALAASSIAPGAAQALISTATSLPELLHDPITGLPNEAAFYARTRELTQIEDLPISVAVFDVQDFGHFRKVHNDVYANSVAMIIRNRLQRRQWIPVDMIARLRDGQFGVLFTSGNEGLITRELAGMQRTLSIPFRLRNRENVLTTHIGAMRKQAHVHNEIELVALARQAAVYARREKSANPRFYTSKDTLG